MEASDANWLVDAVKPGDEFHCMAQIRYNSTASPAVAKIDEQGGLRIEFRRPQFGVAPGQAAVCYDGERVLGGAWIDRAFN